MPYRHTYEIQVRCDVEGCGASATEAEELGPHDGGKGRARDRLREEGWIVKFSTLSEKERVRCPKHRTD